MSRSFWLFGARFTVHANHEDTAGRYDLIEGKGPPGFQTPLPQHNRYSEQFCVLEGEFTVWAGERKAVLHAGDTFTIPAGTPWPLPVTARPARWPSPSRAGSPASSWRSEPRTWGGAPPAGPPDMALFERICAEIGDETLGPPGTLPEQGRPVFRGQKIA
jgi:hypothetical protein